MIHSLKVKKYTPTVSVSRPLKVKIQEEEKQRKTQAPQTINQIWDSQWITTNNHIFRSAQTFRFKNVNKTFETQIKT